jgi:hypothetical protein
MAAKFKVQMQMHISGKQKAMICVAASNFEQNGDVESTWLNDDKECWSSVNT